MKKIYFLIILGCYFSTYGQSIQLAFTGKDAATNDHVEIDSILISNLTLGCDTVLYGNDTMLALSPIGIAEINQEAKFFNLIQNYPNPFIESTNFGLQVSKKERIIIQLYTLVGQRISVVDRVFEIGVHHFFCEGIPGNFYILTASNGSSMSSLKLVSVSSSTGNTAKISHIGHSEINPNHKNIKSDQGFTFSMGDQLKYTAYAMGYFHNVISDSPQISKEYVFVFESPFNFTCSDSIIDERDGKIYHTVAIGSQCWLAENLNIGSLINGSQDQQDNSEIEKYCYNNEEINCENYGGLYQWDEMMQYDTNRANKGICPLGWRLPSSTEWDSLVSFFGGLDIAGQELVQEGSSGFDALFAGRRESSGVFSGMSSAGYLSSSLQTDSQNAWSYYMQDGDSEFYQESSSKNNGYSVRCIKGYPNRLNPLVVIIDTNVYELQSDSLELSQGIYRYLVLDKQKQDTIGIGNVIVGLTDEGYLREVMDASQTSGEITLATEQATLEDLWESCEFSFDIDLGSDSSKCKNGYIIKEKFADGVSLKEIKGDTYIYEINNVTLYQNGPYKISLPSGYFKYTPNFSSGMARGGIFSGFEYFFVRADNASLEASAKLQLSLSAELEVGLIDEDLYSFSRYYLIPPCIVMVADITFKVKDVVSTGATFTQTRGYTQSKLLDFGFLCQSGKCGVIWDPTTVIDSVHPVEYNVIVNLTNKLSLVTETSFKVFGVVGPSFNIDLFDKFEAKISAFEPYNWDMTNNLGFYVEQVFDAAAISDKLSYKQWSVGPHDWPIWNFPDSVIHIKGNDQTGGVNEQLPDSLIVKVVDNFGKGWPLVPTVFTVTDGDGSVSDSIALTSDNGFARTKWTVGPNAGDNKIKASVIKSDNMSHAKESPYEFIATAIELGQPCVDIPTIIHGGQTYNTVQIGDQCWLKENLNIGTQIDGIQDQSDNDTIEKYCYNDSESNCEIYGALYQWNEMRQYPIGTQEYYQGICPEGWHIPSDDDWMVLEGTADSQYDEDGPWNEAGARGYDCGKNLKSNWGWEDDGNGDDAYGFSVLPGGHGQGVFWFSLGYLGNIWTSTGHSNGTHAWYRYFNTHWDNIGRYTNHKMDGLSVRCLKD